VTHLALPDSYDLIAVPFESILSVAVALLIPADLREPEFSSCFRNRRTLAVVMTVPEAPVNEYRRFVLWQEDIRSTRQIGSVESESIAVGVQQAPNRHLRSRVATADTTHYL
jgi:hypothetical protein